MLDQVKNTFAGKHGIACRPARDGLALVGTDDTVVVAKVHTHGEERALVMMAWVCHESAADPTMMLRLAAELGAGAIALDGTSYVIRYVIPAAQVATAPLEGIYQFLGRAARELGQRMLATRQVATAAYLAAFAHAAS